MHRFYSILFIIVTNITYKVNAMTNIQIQHICDSPMFSSNDPFFQKIPKKEPIVPYTYGKCFVQTDLTIVRVRNKLWNIPIGPLAIEDFF